MLKAITFDFWDTLYKAPNGQVLLDRPISAFHQLLQQLGRTVEPERIRSATQDCWRYAHEYQLQYGRDITPRGHIDYILQELQMELTRQEWHQAYQMYTTLVREQPPQLNDGVAETLPRLAEKYKLGVICNTGISPGKILREIMQADDIFRWFECLTFSDEVKWAKPNIKIFNYTLENLHVKNHEAAHVGDDIKTDVAGAKMAGMKAIWLASQPLECFIDCDYQVNSIAELVNLFVD